jgi:hypothetical protein
MEDVVLLLDSSQCDGLLVRQLRSLSLRALQPGQRVLQLGSRPRVFVAVDAGTFRGGSILGGGSMDTEAGTVLLEPGELRPWLCRSVRRKRRRRWPRRRRPRPLATPSHSAKSGLLLSVGGGGILGGVVVAARCQLLSISGAGLRRGGGARSDLAPRKSSRPGRANEAE